MTNECKRFDPMLAGYLDATLDAGDRAALEEHLASCSECTRRLDCLRRLDAACAGLREVSADTAETTALERAVLDRIRRAPAASRRPLSFRLIGKWIPLAAAVAAVLLLGVFLWPPSSGSSGIVWADVIKSFQSAHWSHSVTKDASTGEVRHESWYAPGGRKSYYKLHGERPDGFICDAMYTDYVHQETWRYDRGSNTITISESSGDAFSPELFCLSLLRPASVPGFENSVSPGKAVNGLTSFDVTTKRSLPMGGESQSRMRVWVDDKTKLPVRLESEYTSSVYGQEKAESSITEIDYPPTGPADIYALGVPRDATVFDTRPPLDVQKVMDAAKRCRNAFPKEYKALALQSVESSSGTYVISRREGAAGTSAGADMSHDYAGSDVRVEMYAPVLFGSADGISDLLLAGKVPFLSVGVHSGTKTCQWGTDGKPKVSQDPHGVLGVTWLWGMREYDPLGFNWPRTVHGQSLIKSDDPALSGLIGIEAIQAFGGTKSRHRYWLNPDRDYILQRWDWDDFKDGKWVPNRIEEVTEYAQLSTGQWYAKAKRVSGPTFYADCTYYIVEHPTFDKSTFDPDLRPWATALISVSDPAGAPVEKVKLYSLRIGWQPSKYESAGSEVMIDNLPREGSTDILLFDDSRGLAKAVTVTPQGDEVKLTVALEPGIALEGLVKTESGAPLPGASVLLSAGQRGPGSIPFSPSGCGIVATTTDDRGHYAFNLVSPGVEYCAQIYHDDYGRAQEVVTVDPVARTAKVADSTARDRKRTGGCVTDASTGLPLEGVIVHYGMNWKASYAKSGAWDFGQGYQWEMATDKDGRWSFAGNRLFVYVVFVDDLRHHFASYDAVEAGRMDVDFPLTPIPEPVPLSK